MRICKGLPTFPRFSFLFPLMGLDRLIVFEGRIYNVAQICGSRVEDKPKLASVSSLCVCVCVVCVCVCVWGGGLSSRPLTLRE